MNEMVERVAKALCESDGANWNAATFAETANGDDPEEQRDYWRDKARAAIEAMRDPHIRMLIAGVRAMRTDDLDVTEAELKLGWQAAIDAALASPEGER